MQVLTNENIIKGIRKRDAVVIRFLYKTCYPDIRKLILTNKGTTQDAQDLFQDALLLIYQKIINLGITLNCAFGTYLYSCCRLMWLKELEEGGNKGRNCEYTDTHSGNI